MGRKLGIPEGAEFMTLDDFIVEKVERKKEKKICTRFEPMTSSS